MEAKPFDFKAFEAKWIAQWEKDGIYKTPSNPRKDHKYYVLPQLPYPSGAGLHVGHAEGYTACDIFARYKRMTGKDVLQVIGWDSFGLPAENYAIKTNIHPKISTNQAVENFREQIKRMGISVDWDRETGSHNPDYYKWTQWFFLLMYNQGLVYRDNQMTNWCPQCKTVLANDQVKEGKCERCDTVVEQKEVEVWYFKITDYAERLSKDLDKIDWPAESVKRQRDWIGVSEGATLKFGVKAGEKMINDLTIDVFTTRIDTIYGVTFMALAPESPLLKKLETQIVNKKSVDKYVDAAKNKTEMERQVNKEKTGVKLEGVVAINPVNNKEIPIFVADYVLQGYGTGAIMGVPAHDERDGEFANKMGVDIIEIVCQKEDGQTRISPFTGDGIMMNSGKYDGLASTEFAEKITKVAQQKGWGESGLGMKLRDWSVSRQRFWGAPIPMIHKEISKEEQVLQEKYKNKPDAVIQFHAWGSDPSKHFHPWLHSELEKQKVESFVPALPNPDAPVWDEWIKEAREVVKKESGDDASNTVLIGRSLGCPVALKLAESQKVRKLVLTCPPTNTDFYLDNLKTVVNDDEYKVIKDFMVNDIDFKKVTQNTGEIVLYLSTNDPYIPFKKTEEWIKTTFPTARIVRIRDAGHFSDEAGFTTFPKLLEEVLAPVNLEFRMVTDDDLPVLLPDDVDFMPTGKSPLTYSEKFQAGVEEKYGKGCKREVDTLDTFMCSSWYYMRYLDPKNEEAFASKEVLDTWMPVDFYIGGPEHVTGHLLYSRFFTKVLYDAGYIDFDEPFIYHRHQGLILGEDNRKMSKRWGNVINPIEVIERHGADTLRLYEMFMGPLADTKAWSTKGESGVFRFLQKMWKVSDRIGNKPEGLLSSEQKNEQNVEINKLIQYTGHAIETMHFNTAISKFMEFTNYMTNAKGVDLSVWKRFLIIVAPFAPFVTEELWSQMGEGSVHMQPWPEFDPEVIKSDTLEIPYQINGKTRGKVETSVEAEEQVVVDLVCKQQKIDRSAVKKVVYVKGKIINLVT